MPFELKFTREAAEQFETLRVTKYLAKRYKAVKKALRLLPENPTHPGLQTHPFDALTGPENCKVFEAYAENKTPGAYRIFWCYYPPKSNTITILLITPHP